jgi:hypothetical protein
LFLSVSACSIASKEVNSPQTTLEEFLQIKKGMELQEVVVIIGGEGKQQGDNGRSGTKAHQVTDKGQETDLLGLCLFTVL